jgi:hypothetical protein
MKSAHPENLNPAYQFLIYCLSVQVYYSVPCFDTEAELYKHFSFTSFWLYVKLVCL